MRCKQCGSPFSKVDSFEIWELKRQTVQPDQTGEKANVHLEDAGVFCSRSCVKEYLRPQEQSGIFGARQQM
jgi:hypothetical protein